jgi:hypothetical protein
MKVYGEKNHGESHRTFGLGRIFFLGFGFGFGYPKGGNYAVENRWDEGCWNAFSTYLEAEIFVKSRGCESAKILRVRNEDWYTTSPKGMEEPCLAYAETLDSDKHSFVLVKSSRFFRQCRVVDAERPFDSGIGETPPGFVQFR